jgi:hypothetical protein
MKGSFKRVGLAVLSVLVVSLALEVAARWYRNVPFTYCKNFVETRISLFRSVFPTQYDPCLGWIPKPGDYSAENYWGRSLTILDHGIRSNGITEAPRRNCTILAVGDSFTYGSQVGDNETWPSALERVSGARVINAGVFAYGLDQTVLRAEQLYDVFHPDLIIVSFIPDNLSRTERSVRTGAAKPYFEVVKGKLELRNSPVPARSPRAERIGLFRRLFGYSYFIDALMRATGREGFWYLGDWENRRVHGQGYDIGWLLMERLADFAAEKKVTILVLAQHTEEASMYYPPQTKLVLDGARYAKLPVLDLYGDLLTLYEKNPADFAKLFRGHMTAEGNEFVAQRVNRYLKDYVFVSAP